MELRPYQKEAKEAILSDWESGIRKTLLVLPTGCGKTIVFSSVLEDRIKAHGENTLVLAHRGELLDQAADKLYKSTGIRSAVEKASQHALDTDLKNTVGSVQTLTRMSRLNMFPQDHFDTIVVDEAHHVLSDSYQKILDYFYPAKVLGVTATPDRGDKKNLGKFFENVAYEYTLPQAIKEGYLAPIKAMTLPLEIDMSDVGVQAGDFKLTEEWAENSLDPYLKEIARIMVDICMDRKTVIFLPLISTSKKMMTTLNQYGFRAVEVNGGSRDRAEKLKAFEDGEYNVLCNSMLLTEGWDCPSVDCIIVLRPTKIRSLYAQMVGRGTRLHPGKDHLLLLDFLWHTGRHDLCHPAHLISENDEIARRMTDKLKDSDEPLNIEDLQEEAKNDAVREREEALARELKAARMKRRKLVDPIQFEFSISDESLIDYEPAMGWEMLPPTEKQREALENLGIYPDDIQTAGHASKLLDRLIKRSKAGYSTPKQIRLLEQYGFTNVGMWQKVEASRMIARISSYGRQWRVPDDVIPEIYRPESLKGGRQWTW